MITSQNPAIIGGYQLWFLKVRILKNPQTNIILSHQYHCQTCTFLFYSSGRSVEVCIQNWSWRLYALGLLQSIMSCISYCLEHSRTLLLCYFEIAHLKCQLTRLMKTFWGVYFTLRIVKKNILNMNSSLSILGTLRFFHF